MDKWWHDCRDTLMRRAISLEVARSARSRMRFIGGGPSGSPHGRLRISRCLVSGQSSGLLIPPSENALTAPIDLRR